MSGAGIIDCDFLVIGSGPAGQKAAIQGAKAGLKVMLVERESRLGGICVNRGTIPRKTLRESAVTARAERGDAIELLPLMSRVDSVVTAHDRFSRDQLERNAVRIETGVARFLSPQSIEVAHSAGPNAAGSAAVYLHCHGFCTQTPARHPDRP